MAESVCADCGGTGWKIVEREEATGAERCQCTIRALAPEFEAAAGIPPNFQRASLDNFLLPSDSAGFNALSHVLNLVRNYAKQFPVTEKPGLVLIGDGTGTGKTHLAVAAFRAILAKGFPGVFFDYSNLLDRIRKSYDSASGITDREAYRTALDAEILLLDDLGSQRGTEWVQDTVTSLITYRYNHQKPLIATTNMPDPDAGFNVVERVDSMPGRVGYRTTLADAIGARARSRLFEMCRIVRMPSVEDYRIRRLR